ncbi:3-dehydroquinate synthase [Legionella impletisoli]|uniref:3-dehydroquinate synthase n=1 Tax=Legionella impletisoli TaxID=343510 RepID=A0A917JY78_9GAMM|nr:3-dehydroquinate synthase [Legionella impletisoli]GGI91126.1 3-dehydroquinate synthase [Legionella impletisoli]
MAKSEILKRLEVRLPKRAYPIYIGSNLLSDEALLTQHLNANQALIVTNETIAPMYLPHLKKAFRKIQYNIVILPDGEQHKNQQSLDKIYNELFQNRHHRDTTLIALGGGVIGDMTGFAASTYQRGVRFLQIPTTLLAQVDASVGGKTAINHPQGKNMIGSFYQPHAVIIDLDVLSTLPIREFRAGMAEVIKHAILAGGEFLADVESFLKQSTETNKPTLASLVASCCAIKAQLVEEDEKEAGRRALLNLGHTFAHALEAYTNYQTLRHGEAVGIGLYCAALLSNKMNLLSDACLERIDELLTLASLPRRIPKEIDLNALRDLMSNDKKVKNNVLRFILIKSLGDCYIESAVPHSVLMDTLKNAV